MKWHSSVTRVDAGLRLQGENRSPSWSHGSLLCHFFLPLTAREAARVRARVTMMPPHVWYSIGPAVVRSRDMIASAAVPRLLKRRRGRGCSDNGLASVHVQSRRLVQIGEAIAQECDLGRPPSSHDRRRRGGVVAICCA